MQIIWTNALLWPPRYSNWAAKTASLKVHQHQLGEKCCACDDFWVAADYGMGTGNQDALLAIWWAMNHDALFAMS